MKNTMLLPAASDLMVEAVRARSPYAGLAAVQACSAPVAFLSAAHGTPVSGAGFAAIGLAGLAVVDTQDVPGSPPREAPV